MTITKKLVGVSDYQVLSNDLFWTFLHRVKQDYHRIKWSGYNDSFWWNQVAVSDQFKRRKCPECDMIFELNSDTEEVFEIIET